METGSRERRGDIRLDSFGCAPWQQAQSLSFSNKLLAESSVRSAFETKTLVEHRLHLYLSLFDFLLLGDYFREKKNTTAVPMGGYVGKFKLCSVN